MVHQSQTGIPKGYYILRSFNVLHLPCDHTSRNYIGLNISQASSSASRRVSSVQARAAAKQAELLVRQKAQKRRQELEKQEFLLRQKREEFLLLGGAYIIIPQFS